MPVLSIPTAMTERELGCLAELARDKIVLEMGAQYGASTVAMARTAARLCSVDWHRGDPQAGYTPTLGPFLANLDRHGLEVISDHTTITDYDYRRMMDSWDHGRDDQTRGRNDSLRKAVCVHVGTFEGVVSQLGRLYELVLIDGYHAAYSVERDIRLATGVLRDRKGIIVCHDYGRFEVAEGIAACLYLEWRVDRIVDTLAILTREESWTGRASYDL